MPTLLADALGNVDPTTPLSAFTPTVAVLMLLAAVASAAVTLMLRGSAWFDGRMKAWLTSDEGRRTLRENFWEFTKQEEFAKWVNEKAAHQASNVISATQLSIDKSIREAFAKVEEGLDKRFLALTEELKEDRERFRELEKNFHLFVGAQTGRAFDPANKKE